MAQLDPALGTLDGRWRCMRSFIVQSGPAEFFFVDTTPMVVEYWDNPGDHHYDWRGVTNREDYVGELLKVNKEKRKRRNGMVSWKMVILSCLLCQELDVALAASVARWKFVVGHHTLRSVSDHGDTEELVDLLLPILEVSLGLLS